MMQLNGMSQMEMKRLNPISTESNAAMLESTEAQAEMPVAFERDLDRAMERRWDPQAEAGVALDAIQGADRFKPAIEAPATTDGQVRARVDEDVRSLNDSELRNAQALIAALQPTAAMNPAVVLKPSGELKPFENDTNGAMEIPMTMRDAVRSTTAPQVAGPSPMKEAAEGASQKIPAPSIDLRSLEGISAMMAGGLEGEGASLIQGAALADVSDVEILSPSKSKPAAAKKTLSGGEFLEARRALMGGLNGREISKAVMAKGQGDAMDAVRAQGDGTRSWLQSGLNEPQIGRESQGAQRISMQEFRQSLPMLDLGSFSGMNSGTSMAPVELQARVTQGGMAQDRLNSESILGIARQVAQISQLSNGAANGNGNGEIRLRLTPEHLGEIRLHVRTQGDQVGLSIQTAQPDAQRILEESLPSLRESLSQHRLTLAQVDVMPASTASTVAPAQESAGSSAQGFSGNMSSFGQASQGQTWQERASYEGRGQRDARDTRDVRETSRGAPAMARAQRVSSSGRLDVVA